MRPNFYEAFGWIGGMPRQLSMGLKMYYGIIAYKNMNFGEWID